MVKLMVDDEVGWREDGEDWTGFVRSDPDEMGDFYVMVEDEFNNSHVKTLNENHLPDRFVNYTTAFPDAGGWTDADEPTVITKPQEQSLWTYVAFMLVGGALILNM